MNLPDLGQRGLSKCQKDKIPCSCVACTDNIRERLRICDSHGGWLYQFVCGDGIMLANG
ncbi:MAG: hypothetical protein PARBA_00985 [Parabacteroides sp.]